MESIMKLDSAFKPALIALLLAAPPAFAEKPYESMPMDMDKGMSMDKNMGMGMGMAAFHNPGNIKWGAAPPTLPKGAKLAVLAGDPSKPGPFVMRLMMPASFKIPPHWHSAAESVTVIAGTLYLGMGDTLDMKTANELKTGGFHSIPAMVHHYAFTKKGAVVQIHGEGPFNITYINPADNPDPAAKK